MIKNIISAQQTLSKTIEMEYIISINDLLTDALVISGFDIKNEIKMIKHYNKLPAIQIDKVKLLQVCVNILQNSKEAVLESTKTDKVITITTLFKNDKIIIQIMDNGIGILPKNMGKIYQHGFTTKATGHGFGLHASALTMHSLGGEIDIKSAGLEKGVTVTLTLPYKKL